MLKCFTPPNKFLSVEIKKNYEGVFLSHTQKIIYLFGLKIKHKRLKAPTIFGENNHIILNGREVQKIKGFEIYIEGNDNRVEISLNEKSKIFGNVISFSGNHNSVYIDSPTLIAKTSIYIAKNNNKVFIDKSTTMPKARIYSCNREEKNDSHHCQLLIGKNFACGENLHISLNGIRRKISIGDNCMFSWNVYVWTTDGHLIFDKTTGERSSQEQNVVIGNHVWVGRHASVHKGAIVPDGCIVGANSFVTKAFRENNVILAGTPAKVVRRNIRWER